MMIKPMDKILPSQLLFLASYTIFRYGMCRASSKQLTSMKLLTSMEQVVDRCFSHFVRAQEQDCCLPAWLLVLTLFTAIHALLLRFVVVQVCVLPRLAGGFGGMACIWRSPRGGEWRIGVLACPHVGWPAGGRTSRGWNTSCKAWHVHPSPLPPNSWSGDWR